MASTNEDFLHNEESPGETEWIPLSLTFVEYPKGDWIGKIMAISSLLPLGIVSGFVALILFRRDLHTIIFFLGTLLSEMLNLILKNIICEPRPMSRSVLYTEYGMPSAHAQFSWFFATYLIYFVLIRLHHMNNNTTLENVWKTVIILTCIFLAILISFSRIYLQYHTWKQVIWGAFVGISFGTLWFAITYLVFTPCFPVIVSWKISELLLIRDTTLIPNILWFEYTNSRQEARARGRKLVSVKSQ
ncbi:hypothetical protein O3M35_005270 [Rhynocoris fuscipes]|uniref:Dolichyldiphosphatase n=1 Tax=Rhynocoris fuscipes TaxID=488301 RepID=A0AAW1DI31_9HEMI